MRTRINIDWEETGKAIVKGANGVDIAQRLGIHDKTLYRRCLEDLKITFAEFSAQKKAIRRMRIKELQMELAEEKNLQMLIWLGKQYCDQREPEPKTPTFTKAAVLQYVSDQKKGGKNEEPNDDGSLPISQKV